MRGTTVAASSCAKGPTEEVQESAHDASVKRFSGHVQEALGWTQNTVERYISCLARERL